MRHVNKNIMSNVLREMSERYFDIDEVAEVVEAINKYISSREDWLKSVGVDRGVYSQVLVEVTRAVLKDTIDTYGLDLDINDLTNFDLGKAINSAKRL